MSTSIISRDTDTRFVSISPQGSKEAPANVVTVKDIARCVIIAFRYDAGVMFIDGYEVGRVEHLSGTSCFSYEDLGDSVVRITNNNVNLRVFGMLIKLNN